MTRIIFVDDEPNVLMGLKDALRKQRRIWDMTFVEGGQQALDYLSHNSVDIIVSDMRMPQMDGTRRFTCTREQDIENPREFDEYVARRQRQDPDCWFVELDGPDVERLIDSAPR